MRIEKVDSDFTVMSGNFRACPTCLSYHDNRNFTVQRITQANGEPADPLLFPTFPIGWKYWDFPLEVKKTWRFTVANTVRSPPRRTVDCTVESYEDVITKAATFGTPPTTVSSTSTMPFG